MEKQTPQRKKVSLARLNVITFQSIAFGRTLTSKLLLSLLKSKRESALFYLPAVIAHGSATGYTTRVA